MTEKNITARSVLLSTNRRNAPIPLVNRNIIKIHHTHKIVIVYCMLCLFIRCLLCKNSRNACKRNQEARRISGQLQKFMITVKVSGAIPNNHADVGKDEASLNQNAKKPFHKYGNELAPLVHQ
jgi:hypothetical protein